MSADEFFNRWAKKNEQARHLREQEQREQGQGNQWSQASQQGVPVASEAGHAPADPWQDRAPTLDDVAALPKDAGIAPFMKQGVDEGVRRAALKKLFTDPHFNIMDGLDIYIDDYTKSDPIPPEMLAMLQHAKSALDPEGLKDKLVMAMESAEEAPGIQPAQVAGPDTDSEVGSQAGQTAETAEAAEATAAAEAPDQAGTAPAAAKDKLGQQDPTDDNIQDKAPAGSITGAGQQAAPSGDRPRA